MKRVVVAQTETKSDMRSEILKFLDEHLFDNFESGLAAIVEENVPGYNKAWANEKPSIDDPAELKLIRHRNDYLDAVVAGLFALKELSGSDE